jgi:hypothetical protein
MNLFPTTGKIENISELVNKEIINEFLEYVRKRGLYISNLKVVMHLTVLLKIELFP